MSRLLVLSVTLAVPFCLVTILPGVAGEPPAAKSPDGREPDGRDPDGRRVTKYTKLWTDDYGNYHKDVYLAYIKTLKDEHGDEIATEIWHGNATGFHENGKKSWEADYRDGKREGEFSSWSDNGTRTGLTTFQHGLIHGKYSEWHRDGRKMRKESYEKGKLNGQARWWDGEGKLLTTGTNRDGVPWGGTFPELDSSPGARWVIRRYEDGKKVSEEKLTGNWWW
jgi:hypothetical protein